MEAFWVFGYGSLMWKPGFKYQEAQRAHVTGYHRALCIYSHHHRGTAENPGLVMGLNKGGACCGVAFYIDKDNAEDAYRYLVGREQVNGTYREEHITLELADKRVVNALVFATDETHAQFAGNLSSEKIAEIITPAWGVAGSNSAYLLNTVAALRSMEIHDAKLEDIMHHLPEKDKQILAK